MTLHLGWGEQSGIVWWIKWKLLGITGKINREEECEVGGVLLLFFLFDYISSSSVSPRFHIYFPAFRRRWTHTRINTLYSIKEFFFNIFHLTVYRASVCWLVTYSHSQLLFTRASNYPTILFWYVFFFFFFFLYRRSFFIPPLTFDVYQQLIQSLCGFHLLCRFSFLNRVCPFLHSLVNLSGLFFFFFFFWLDECCALHTHWVCSTSIISILLFTMK